MADPRPRPGTADDQRCAGSYEAGIAECARVLVPGTGLLLVKCQDMTYNHRLHLVFLDVLRRMTAAGVDLADMFPAQQLPDARTYPATAAGAPGAFAPACGREGARHRATTSGARSSVPASWPRRRQRSRRSLPTSG